MLQAAMIDSREPDWVQKLKFDGVPSIVTTLEYGDFWGTTDDGALICIERKTPTDLLGSIRDNRLFAQCAGMRGKTKWSYLVVTGVLRATRDGKVVADERITGWPWDSVSGALLTVQELGVGIVHTDTEQGYEAAVLRLARRKRGEEYIIEPKMDSRTMSHAEQVLTSLPGVGWQRAQDMLRVFDGRACEALAWLTWMGTFGDGPAGVGNGTKSSVRKALGLVEGEELYCWDKTAWKYYEDWVKSIPVEAEDVGNETQVEA
jgi:ERCC4-type nuclease